MRVVSKIDPKKPVCIARKRVAAYARVSVESDRTLHSLSAQVSFYSALIQKHREWIYAGVYADCGITGTSDNRAEFQRMLADCEAGKIDIILTKSISRFARNTVDLLATIRRLRELEIEVRFEKERINSLTEDGELMLTLLASSAQEESRSISENIKWAIRKGYSQGKVRAYTIYGYRWKDRQCVIVPEEARAVRLIFDSYLAGMTAGQIETLLEKENILSYTGGHFCQTSIRQILVNEKYTGNMLFQKKYVVDHITHKKRVNHGELPKYYAEGTHPAIIRQEVFDAVQAEKARRMALGVFANPAIRTNCFTSKIICERCGKSYHRRDQPRKTSGPYKVWRCVNRPRKDALRCHSKDIPECVVKHVSAEVLGLAEFDESAFHKRIEKITIPANYEMSFHFYDGSVVTKPWTSPARARQRAPEYKAEQSESMACMKEESFHDERNDE